MQHIYKTLAQGVAVHARSWMVAPGEGMVVQRMMHMSYKSEFMRTCSSHLGSAIFIHWFTVWHQLCLVSVLANNFT